MTGADGEMPVPDGEYTLADGMMVTLQVQQLQRLITRSRGGSRRKRTCTNGSSPQGSPVVKSEKSTQEVLPIVKRRFKRNDFRICFN
jgi:hypothetical protein